MTISRSTTTIIALSVFALIWWATGEWGPIP